MLSVIAWLLECPLNICYQIWWTCERHGWRLLLRSWYCSTGFVSWPGWRGRRGGREGGNGKTVEGAWGWRVQEEGALGVGEKRIRGWANRWSKQETKSLFVCRALRARLDTTWTSQWLHTVLHTSDLWQRRSGAPAVVGGWPFAQRCKVYSPFIKERLSEIPWCLCSRHWKRLFCTHFINIVIQSSLICLHQLKSAETMKRFPL